ncbi:MAG: 1,3-beta-galactosyl-N-acetylhexosamine phosphorylase [Kiritimatiellales bacterium]
MNYGRVTLPAEAGYEKETAELMRRWGADAVRNSDGTELSAGINALGATVYSTLCLIRADQDYAYAHRQFVHHRVLMSDPRTAGNSPLTIELLAGFFARQFEIDWDDDPQNWWEVIDRTTGDLVAPENWSADKNSGTVIIQAPAPGHVYTVNFFVRQIWEPTSMYNHLTNGWTRREAMGIDPRFPSAGNYLLDWLKHWLEKNPEVDVVRLTSLFYHFTITGGTDGSPRHTDWFGYHDAVSPYALELFEQEHGYRPALETFIDGGSYNGAHRIPDQAVKDWMDFVQKFVRAYAGKVNELIHAAGKISMFFFGDHWIGAEPYLAGFPETGFDYVVGSVTCGEDLRRIADIPGSIKKEIRMQPYLFPDLFDGQHNTAGTARQMWVAARRALLRNPVIDRIGYGGYLSLAAKDEAFVAAVESICNEFRDIIETVGGQKPYTVARVGILNAWGRCRSWMTGPRWYEKFNGRGLSEALSGLPFDVSFLNFDDIKTGALDSIDVLINEGREGSAWSGGKLWADLDVQEKIRAFVKSGGALLGVSDPSAHAGANRIFQLADVFGVDKESGATRNCAPAKTVPPENHFLKNLPVPALETNVFPAQPTVQILAAQNNHVLLAAHEYGAGRAVYLSRIDCVPEQVQALRRILLWLAGKEDELSQCSSENPAVDAVFFPAVNQWIVANNSPAPQTAAVYNPAGEKEIFKLQPYELQKGAR